MFLFKKHKRICKWKVFYGVPHVNTLSVYLRPETLTTCLQIKSTTGLFYKHKAHYHKVELVNQVLSVGMLQLTAIL